MNDGCRGEFEVRRGGGNPGSVSAYTVSCNSRDGRYTTCAWEARRGVPRLQKQLSNAPCTRGRTLGYRAGQVWVGEGCRATFTP